MTDVVDPQTRSRMMSGIRGKDTKPELLIRKGLYARGFRYRLNVKTLPGKPDIVLAKYNAVVLVQGCFWHVHDCHLFKWPKSKSEWWHEKLMGNVARDKTNIRQLNAGGWRVMQVWECALKGKTRRPVEEVLDEVADWITGSEPVALVEGDRSQG